MTHLNWKKVFVPIIIVALFCVNVPPAHAGPATVTITMSSYALEPGQSATVTFTFPTPPASFTASNISAPNGAISNVSSTTDPLVYTATFVAAYDGSSQITVSGVATTTVYANIGSDPYAIASDGTNIWVANQYGDSVTKITPAGATTTYAGIGGWPNGIAFDGTNMWTANYYDSSVTKITPTGATTTYTGTGTNPSAIAFDGTNM